MFLLAASLTRTRFAGRVIRLCVRPWRSHAALPQVDPFPLHTSFPSAASSVVWGRFDSQPQLDATLRFSLAPRPHRRPYRWSRPGLLGSNVDLSHVIQSTTPVKRHRLAKRRHTAFDKPNGLGLHDLPTFGANYPHPTRPLSTLQTPRYRDACKTRFRPARYGSDRSGLSPRVFVSFVPAHSAYGWKIV